MRAAARSASRRSALGASDSAKVRSGTEAARILVDSMVSGVYAGNSEELELGSCFPKLYDLEREQATELMCWPFAVMDSALHERMGLDAGQALAEVERVHQLVRGVQGTFISVWHDRYLSGYRNFAPWPGVLRKAVQLARA